MSLSRDNLSLLMQAAIDGEIDRAGVLDLERQVADDPVLATEYKNLAALKALTREKLRVERAPEALRAKIAALAGAPGEKFVPLGRPPVVPPRKVWSSRSWMSHAATGLIAACLGVGATLFAAPPGRPSIGDQVVAAHMRGLVASSPVDVASTDRHTVKPWFDTRLARSPLVLDLSAQGYVLVGGRADVIGGSPAPTLVYKQREHLLSVTAIPADSRDSAPVNGTSISGYRALAWRDGDFTYWVASDIDRGDLEAFVAAFRKAAETTR